MQDCISINTRQKLRDIHYSLHLGLASTDTEPACIVLNSLNQVRDESFPFIKSSSARKFIGKRSASEMTQ